MDWKSKILRSDAGRGAPDEAQSLIDAAGEGELRAQPSLPDLPPAPLLAPSSATSEGL